MSIQRSLKHILAAILFLGVLAAAPVHTSTAAARPNVLVIVTDDQRQGTGVMPKTLSWLRDGGVRYRNAFVTTPLCCPSRASTFSGQYAHNTGVKTNSDAHLLRQGRTMQRYLRDAGYRTALFGKYLNKWPLNSNPPNFHRWAFYTAPANGYIGDDWNVDGTIKRIDEYVTRYIADRAISFIDYTTNTLRRPWFMYLATPSPHSPYTAESKYASASVPGWDGNPAVFEEDKSDKPPWIQAVTDTYSDGNSVRRKQLRTLMSVDDMVNRVMSELEAVGQLSNTLVIFKSDNGYLWAEHGWIGKRLPYTQSIKVPMFARWDGHLPAGTEDSRFVANIDIAPTVFQATGTSPQYELDGHSLLSSYSRSRMLTEYWLDQGADIPTWASLRTSDAQYMEYYDANGDVTFTEYYDLSQDSWQLTNLGTAPPTLVTQLAADRTCAGASCP